MERKSILHPPLAINKTILYKNCICIPVPPGHTCPLKHCIMPPFGGVPHYLRNAAIKGGRVPAIVKLTISNGQMVLNTLIFQTSNFQRKSFYCFTMPTTYRRPKCKSIRFYKHYKDESYHSYKKIVREDSVKNKTIYKTQFVVTNMVKRYKNLHFIQQV